jgi:hypothetical protein
MVLVTECIEIEEDKDDEQGKSKRDQHLKRLVGFDEVLLLPAPLQAIGRNIY